MKLLLLLASLTAFSAVAETVSVSTYAPDTPAHEAQIPTDIDLPEGWSTMVHNDNLYIIGGGRVYGSLTFSYSKLSIANWSRQFGMPDPPKRDVAGVEVRYQVNDNNSATYGRKIGYTWFLRGSVTPYPDYANDDLDNLFEEFLTIVASAKPQLPEIAD